MKLHIFNPENDMALADGQPGYTAPANIIAYRNKNWELPLQWADTEDIVWDGKTSLKNLPEDCEICPWGWSKALVHQLEIAGVPKDRMPSNEELDRLRILSSRETTVKVQQLLGVEAYACHSIEELETRISESFTLGNALSARNNSTLSHEKQDMKFILKSPWSSSGKGLMPITNPAWKNWAKRILRLQGCVIVERMLDRALDFAMEFWRQKDGTVRYLGLSVFYTTDKGTYISNFDGTEEEKQEMIEQRMRKIESLESIRNWYLQYLSKVDYSGPVGIDMMVTKDGAICPCIEINWRMTMGIVSLMKQRPLK